MCLNPIKTEGKTFSCRSCDECIERRLNGWVQRALAEAVVAGHTYAITATYKNLPSGEKPIGATVFNYKDIQTFLWHLRARYSRHYKTTGEIRYLACGEQGSKGTKRVHWHIILYTDKDIRPVINWIDFETKKQVAPCAVQTEKNYLADVWPHGHIMLQKPDMRGIKYALKYALKGEQGIEKSAGTNRYAKAEEWAAHYFRMSKKPPIGLRYLEGLVIDAAKGGYVYPSFEVQVPNSDGFWYLEGYFAEYWAAAMSEINQSHREAYGTDCGAWRSLLTDAENREKDATTCVLSEVLHHGAWKTTGPTVRAIGAAGADVEARLGIAERQRQEAASWTPKRDGQADDARRLGQRLAFERVVRRCGGIAPCADCKRGHPERDKAPWVADFAAARDIAYSVNPPPRWGSGDATEAEKAEWDRQFASAFRRYATEPGPYCGLRNTDAVQQAFDWYAEHIQRIERGRAYQPKAHGYKGKAAPVAGGRSQAVPGHRGAAQGDG